MTACDAAFCEGKFTYDKFIATSSRAVWKRFVGNFKLKKFTYFKQSWKIEWLKRAGKETSRRACK